MSNINRRLGLAFVHIPKTGGVAVCESLGLAIRGHQRLSEMRRFRRRYFSFCFVRNPWDRMVSAYSYFRAGGRGHRNDIKTMRVVRESSTFPEFCSRLEDPEFKRRLERCRSPHFLPQVHWHDPRIKLVGRFDNFAEDFKEVCTQVGLPDTELLVRNTSEHLPYPEYYTESAAQIVERVYKEDIEKYNYKFGD